jgi:PBP1b-binding outer membrane lipoprotein LpoB
MTSISRLMALLIAAIVLTGCSSPVRDTMSDEEIEAKDDSVCRSFGLQRGTTDYTDCRLKLRTDRRLKQ